MEDLGEVLVVVGARGYCVWIYQCTELYRSHSGKTIIARVNVNQRLAVVSIEEASLAQFSQHPAM